MKVICLPLTFQGANFHLNVLSVNEQAFCWWQNVLLKFLPIHSNSQELNQAALYLTLLDSVAEEERSLLHYPIPGLAVVGDRQ